MIIFWLAGFMFTLGFSTVSKECQPESFWEVVGWILGILMVWPAILGLLVAEVIRKKGVNETNN